MTEESSGFTDYVLAEMRAGVTRAKLWQNDLTAIGLGLKIGLIDVDNALDHLADCGALRLIAAPSANAVTSISSST